MPAITASRTGAAPENPAEAVTEALGLPVMRGETGSPGRTKRRPWPFAAGAGPRGERPRSLVSMSSR